MYQALRSRFSARFALLVLVTASAMLPVAAGSSRAASPTQEEQPKVFLSLLAFGARGSSGGNANSGFRPEVNGFSFENYGGDQGYTNLTPVEVRRMFGDKVCASAIQNGSCDLTPAADKWMKEQNEGMNGGHCEGFAVLSLLFFDGTRPVNQFGAATTAELQIDGNQPLQREIAYWFTTQATRPANQTWVKGTPTEILERLRQSYLDGKIAEFAVGFYKRGGGGGHAVTPIGVEDRGNGISAILIYDNNYPKTVREIIIDTNKNTWSYTGSTNPAVPADEYEGDAETRTLELAPIAPRIPQQECTFCELSSDPGIAQTNPISYNEVWLDGDGDLLITDIQGRRIGYDTNGKFVNEISGSEARSNKFLVPVWLNDEEPTYKVPASVDFSISIDGNRITETTETNLTLFGPGYVLEAQGINLEPGQVDVLDVLPNGSLLSYRTETGESPDLLLGIETLGADYTIVVKGFDLGPNGAVNLSLNEAQGTVSVDSLDVSQPVGYDILVERTDANGSQVFGTGDDITIGPNDVMYIEYAKWGGNGQPLPVGIDRNNDGTIDETLNLADVTDQFDE